MAVLNLKNKKLPQIGIGTYLMSDDQAEIAVGKAFQIGYRHVDTAEGYKNEEGVGRAIARAFSDSGLKREDIFVTTKLWPGNPRWGTDTKDYQSTMAAFDSSLQKLGLEYIDLYLIHAPFAINDRVEQWRACCDLKQKGKALSVGVSNYNRKHIQEIKTAGLANPDANQIELHPWCQKPELVSFLKEEQITIIAYSSLVPLTNWRTEPGQHSCKTDTMKGYGVADVSYFEKVAKKYRVTVAQLLLRWAVQKGYAVLPKTVSGKRMEENFKILHFQIDNIDMLDIGKMNRGDGVAWRSGDPCQSE